MKRITVYGSLKRGKYNHAILEDQKFIGNTKIKGTLYSLGAYPAIVDEGDNVYDAEVYEVDEKVYNLIHRIEMGAGYKEVEVNEAHLYDDSIEKKSTVFYADSSLKDYCQRNCRVIETY